MVSWSVHLIPGPVAEGLPHQQAAIGGSINGHIVRPLFQPALQNGFYHRIGAVILVEGQVVDEENKPLLPSRQTADQPRHIPQSILLDLNEP